MRSLRAIWRPRRPSASPILVALGGILVVLGGLLVVLAVLVPLGGTKPVTPPNAVAWTTVALDTPKSQLVSVAPPGADTLPWRASLLTHLMASETSVRDLASRVGVSADQLVVVDPVLGAPVVPTATAQAAAKAASLTAAPYALTVFVENQSLPVISIEAAAPDRLLAHRLADAAVAVLESQASPGGRFSSGVPTGGKTFERQPFVIGAVAPVRVKLLPAPASPLKPIGGAFLAFLGWCAVVVLLRRLSRASMTRRAALPA